ncbi:hypothetical protein BH09GEM1_BH09GEM1_42560 [soil metagenome]
MLRRGVLGFLVLAGVGGNAGLVLAQKGRPAVRSAYGPPRYSVEAIRRDVLDYLNNPTIRYRMIQKIEADYGMVGWRVVAEQLTGDLPSTRRTAAELFQCAVPAGVPKARNSECVAAAALPELRKIMVPQLHRSLDMSGDHVSAWQALRALQATDSITFSRAIALRLGGTEMPVVHDMMRREDYVRQLPELVAAFTACRKGGDQFCEEQFADWIGHAGAAAIRFAPLFESMAQEDVRARKRSIQTISSVLAASGDFAAVRPLLLNPNYPLLNPSGLGVAPPAEGVAFIVSVLDHDADKVNVNYLSNMLGCYGPVALAPAEKVLIKLSNDPEYMRMEGVTSTMRILRKQQEPSGECVRHSGAWRNPQ